MTSGSRQSGKALGWSFPQEDATTPEFVDTNACYNAGSSVLFDVDSCPSLSPWGRLLLLASLTFLPSFSCPKIVIVLSDGETVSGTTAEGMTAAIKEAQARQNGTSVVFFTVEESEHSPTPSTCENFQEQS
jgi:hypothetical protein